MDEPRSSTSSAARGGRSSTSAARTPTSSSSSSSSRPAMTPRRSLAHAPRLLGLGEDGVIALHGLGISSASSDRFRSASSVSPTNPVRTLLEEEGDEGDERFRIDEEDDNETLAGESHAQHREAEPSHSEIRQSGDSRRKSASTLAPIRIESYKGLEGYQAEQGEESAMIDQEQSLGRIGNDTDDLERNGTAKHTPNNYAGIREEDVDQDADLDGPDHSARLYFEPTSGREKLFMWMSVVLVTVLTATSIAIAVNWIDWPGDGIGKD